MGVRRLPKNSDRVDFPHICSKEGIWAKIRIHLLFLGVAGPPSRHRPHFHRNEFHPKRLKMRTISGVNSVWLQGFWVRWLGGDVRWILNVQFIHWIWNNFLVTTVNWIICSNKGILAKIETHPPFLGVAGDSHKRWSHFNTIEFHPKRLNMRTLIRGKPAWLQGFCLEVTRWVPEMGPATSVFS